MKKFALTVLFSAIYVLSLAQPQPLLSPRPADGDQQNRYEQIQSAKIAFFTSELELSPKEAEEFWPIYNNFWKEREKSYRRIQGNLKNIEKALSGESKISETELKSLMDKYVSGFSSEGEIFKNFHSQFMKILPSEKVAKIYVTEEKFRVKMIHQLRRGHGGSGTTQNLR
ncbi:MAG: hypothetical protein QMB82_09625 [Bacteroidales bacterium]